MNGLFSSNSPIESEGISGTKQKPAKVSAEKAECRLAEISERSHSLIHAREQVNKVHSEGYFENHYKDADKKLKKMLHEKVLLSWRKMISERVKNRKEKEEEAPESRPRVIITIEQ